MMAEDVKPTAAQPTAEAAPGAAASPAANPQALAQKGPPLDVTKESQARLRVREALAAETQLEFPDNTLREVLDYLAQVHHVPILPEEAVKAELERTCSLTLSGVSVATGLGILLKDDLDYLVDDGFLRITTRSAARARTETRLYNIREFANVGMTSDDVIAAVTFAIEADKTDLGGVVALKDVLVVSQNQRSQARVLELLEGLRRAVAVQNGSAE